MSTRIPLKIHSFPFMESLKDASYFDICKIMFVDDVFSLIPLYKHTFWVEHHHPLATAGSWKRLEDHSVFTVCHMTV